MEMPRIILRYRDVVPDKDTIREHQQIINTEGVVCWGWWKKQAEETQSHLFSDNPGSAYILDSSKKNLYQVKYSRCFLTSKELPKPHLVPEYYRNNISEIEGWFEITFIEKVVYNEHIETTIGQNTFAQVSPNVSEKSNLKPKFNPRSKKSSILHLSDIHFGKDHGFKKEKSGSMIETSIRRFSDVLIEDLEAIKLNEDIEAIVITGDLTTKGDWSDKTSEFILKEIKAICTKLNVKTENVFIAPGNHDIVRYAEDDSRDIRDINISLQSCQKHEQDLRLFIDSLTGRHWRKALDYLETIKLKDIDLNLLILNSCRVAAEGKWTEYGFVGSAGIQVLNEIKSISNTTPTFSLMALHHHLLPVNRVDLLHEKGVSLTLDAVQLLDKASEVGVQIALHGHQHCSRVAKYERVKYFTEEKDSTPITIVSGGSGGVNKNRRADSMKNSYSVLTFNRTNVKLNMREISNDSQMHQFLYKDIELVYDT